MDTTYRRKINGLSREEQKQRALYLKQIAKGEIYGPVTGVPSVDKIWLAAYKDEDILAEPDDMSAYQQLWDRNKENLDYIALNYLDLKVTYKTLFEKINIIANGLAEAGIKKGDVVGICLPNTPESIYIFYAANKIGAIANMIDLRFKKERLISCISETHTKILFAFDKILPLLNDSLDSLQELTTVVSVKATETAPFVVKVLIACKDSGKNANNSKVVSYGKFVKNNRTSKEVESVYDSPIPAIYEHTSGTTGASKTVVLGNEVFMGIQRGYEVYGFLAKEQDVFLNIIPPFMAYGILPSIHFPLCSKFQLVLIPKFEEEKFYDQLIKYKVGMTNATKMHWGCVKKRVEDLEIRKSAIEKQITVDKKSKKKDLKELNRIARQLKKTDFSTLTVGGIGGDAINIEFEKQINTFLAQYGCPHPLTKGYGMTEVGSTFTADTIVYKTREGSVGIPFVLNEVMIYDMESHKEQGYNVEGDLYISGPTMMRGYLNNPKGTAETIVEIDGKCWINTGDIAFISDEGALHIVGRKKRMIIVDGGLKVFPIMIENVIAQLPEVEDVCVVGVPDEERINILKVHLILKTEFKDKGTEVIEKAKSLCKEKIMEQSLPSLYQIDEEFPKTPNEKVDIKEIERRDRENLS